MAYHSNGYSPDERDLDRDRDDRSNEGGEKPTYLMEHLATFTVSKDTGIVYPADGMRRLLQLEKTNGIWSQKMQLCLDRPWVLVMDYETGVIMHLFKHFSFKMNTLLGVNKLNKIKRARRYTELSYFKVVNCYYLLAEKLG